MPRLRPSRRSGAQSRAWAATTRALAGAARSTRSVVYSDQCSVPTRSHRSDVECLKLLERVRVFPDHQSQGRCLRVRPSLARLPDHTGSWAMRVPEGSMIANEPATSTVRVAIRLVTARTISDRAAAGHLMRMTPTSRERRRRCSLEQLRQPRARRNRQREAREPQPRRSFRRRETPSTGSEAMRGSCGAAFACRLPPRRHRRLPP